MPRFF
jgi:adenylate kinase